MSNNHSHSTNGGHSDDNTLEKDFSNSQYLNKDTTPENALHRIRTAGSISISPELFEKIYLSPQNKVAGELRKTVGNPTPVALVGFLLSLTPLSCILIGWRGAGGSGASDTAAYFFFGGILMILGGIGEFLIGNTFPCVVFTSFGAFWLTYGGTLQPFFNAYGAYSTTGVVADGLTTKGFNASFAFFMLWMGVLCLLYSILALRTNIVFFLILFLLVPAFCCLAGVFWHTAEGNAAEAAKLLKAAGGITLAIDLLGWYILTAVMLAAVDFPFVIPVGDLSTIVKGASEKAKAKAEREEFGE
ncbi:hypothetical protein K461DRAFT_322226 [Myriangium duriaei CBS 260.36]|uniref:GPR1/FUN34/YaaH-class plasma membrane protein n=1 Tax=Myriangium duriaei CBS 260.36 TaxID=1168546 RepID=A0A9P4MGH5_9PEZI|nr:hypothetical protein K461DRAFT_322226 [Myriangium duriaei CBS 260.36]